MIDKVSKRKIVLLDLLYESNGLTVQAIQMKKNLDRKTITNDLKELLVGAPYSKEELSIEKIDKKYFLVMKEKVNIEHVKMCIKKDSLLFNIYYSILNEDFVIRKEAAVKFFCSQSKLYSQLDLVKKCVEKDKIYIDKKGKIYYLKGSEVKIRFQANKFLWNYCTGIKTLINEEMHYKIEQLLLEIEKDLGMIFLNIDRHNLMNWIWISKIRIDIGKFLKNVGYYEELSLNLKNVKTIKEKILLFLGNTSQSNLDQEINFLLLILIITLKKYRNNVGIERNKKGDIYYLGSEFMKDFGEKFDVKTSYLSILSLVGEALFYHQNFDIDIGVGQRKKNLKIELFDQKFHLFFADFVLENEIKIKIKIKIKNIEILYDYVYSLCYGQVNHKIYRPLIRVVVNISSGEDSEYRVKQELSKLDYNINFEEKEFESADLIITDYINVEFEDKIFYCSSVFSSTIALKLDKVLRKLEENRLVRILENKK